ncbi:uncharacterized protein LOC127862703 [Dreissena polymorpha]|uniref:Assembly chaperone of rpl4 n=1 Tax=Dreissena polymorpha TaxID=45954 RepID=A0A9D4BC42_DREPO|nr:uncharacterized protein LOC127862703 [Dreissena polymorpha]KAH3697071.1 hypothetical protein DPMN_084556 [Dreissena polymorpha]
MGKNKFKRKQGESLDERKKRLQEAAKQTGKNDKKKDAKPKYTLDQLLDKAEECIDKFEYEMAQKFCQRALEMEPDNVRVLETSGSLLIDLGNIEGAKQCFGRAVEVCPNEGYSKYMNLGQLFEGAMAVECFQKGIELMLVEKEKREKEEVAAACGGSGSETGVTNRAISEAYLSIAEIYMTDCCFDEDAEEKCRSHIEKAMSQDTSNPDALQLMASFLLSKEQTDGAREHIKKSVSLWLPEFKASEQPEASTSAPFECPQSFESRLAAGKILIEVEEHELAIEVLETLLEENDEVVDVWYLIGWANHELGDEGRDSARSYLNKALKVYRKSKCEDAELLKHIEELLETLGTGDDVMDSDIDPEDIDDADDNLTESEEEEEEEMIH